MASNQPVATKFTWGDTVRIRDDAPAKFKELGAGSVCGIRRIDNEKVAQVFDEPVGTVLYIIESGDGKSKEVPERFLESY